MAEPAVRGGGEVGRWDPVAELTDIQRRISQLMDSVSTTPVGDGQAWRPLAEVTETDDGYVVEVEVPGVTREDLTLNVSGNELEISGEFVEKKKTGWMRTRSRTRRIGSFEYRTLLPRDIDAEKITAALADGVLTVKVPKSESAKPRRIEVTTEHRSE